MSSLDELIPRLWATNTVNIYGSISLKIFDSSFRPTPKNAVKWLNEVT
tara:strand:+ start:10727 stop:10870 length:144 start_codon:yes stop_codon:yes gene_type:complete